ncbi:MAG: guanylate kinase [Faecousia sp.]
MSKGRLFVISGASGVGKSTVLKRVMAARQDLLFSVSATSRPPRAGEQEGIHYYFVSEEAFRKMIEADELLEYDLHNKTYYGTPRLQLLEKLERGNVVLDVEPNGAFHVREARPDATLIFIMPPSVEELETRLRGRGDTSPEQVALRLERARWEMEQRTRYDYVVVNDVVERCAEEILDIIARHADE